MELSRDEWMRMSVPERLQLVDEIWESIADDAASLPLTDAQRTDLDDRLREYEQNPSAIEPWKRVRGELERDA